MEAEDRVARVLVRARYLALPEEVVGDLARALRGGDDIARVATGLRAACDAKGEQAVAAMLALGFGGPDPALDAVDRAALAMAGTEPSLRQAFLARVDPAAAGWRGLAAFFAAREVALDEAVRGCATHAASWVALDGSLAAVGDAVVRAVAASPEDALCALLDGGDARELVVTRLVRAVLAASPRDDGLARDVLQRLPQGLRGSAADPLLARDTSAFEGDVVALARDTRATSRADRLAAIESLLRHRPDAARALAAEVLDDDSADAIGLQSQVLLALGRGDPSGYAARALAQARRDPGAWAAELAAAWPPDAARPLWEALHASGNADLAARAVPALLRVAHPARLELALRLLRDPGEVPREVVVDACAALDDDEARGLGALLGDGTSEVRLAAVRALAGHREVAEALLTAHYPHERSGRVRAAIASLLGHAPVATTADAAIDDPVRAAIASRAEATVVTLGKKRPAWLAGDAVPPLRWWDGSPAPASVGLHLVVIQSRRGGVDPDPEVVATARELHPADRVAWAEAVLSAWIAADAPAKDHGALLLAALLGGEFATAALRDAIPAWHRSSRRALATSATQLLVMRATDDALRALDALAAGHPHESFGALARSALDEEALARGVEVEALLDGCVPTFGLDAEGAVTLDLGFHRARAVWRGGAVSLDDGEGTTLHGLPRPGRRDDPDKVAAARRQWRLLTHALPEVVARERERLRDAMASSRAWSGEALRGMLAHPVLSVLARGLSWELDGAAYHGADLPAALSDVRVARVCYTASEPVARLPDALREEAAWRALAGRTLTAKAERHARAVPGWTRQGWSPGTVEDGLCREFRLRFTAARIDAVLRVDGIALWSDIDRRTRVGALEFVPWTSQDPLPLGSLPASLFRDAVARAEAMLDPQG